jgi:2'-5' RNA ligase
MQCSNGEQSTLGHFALVSYIPKPLAGFLDDLRLELTPGCNPRAHVTVLPPRPHLAELQPTIDRIRERCATFEPFRVELGEIETFNLSHVIFLGVGRGAEELQALYRSLNCGDLTFSEKFPFHPHITIAQTRQPDESAWGAAQARRKWAEFAGPRTFDVSRLSFVQHVAPSIWMDVAPVPLGYLIAANERSIKRYLRA